MSIKILVIDDEYDLQMLIKKRFKEKINSGELDFQFASDGAEGLQKLNADNGIEVIFTDLRMPVMDGLTFLEKLKSKNLITKAIVISAYDDFENIRVAMNRGAFDFITKPIDFDDLEITLYKAIEEYLKIKEGLEAKENLKQSVFDKTIAQEKLLEALMEKEQLILKQNEMLERMVEERTHQLAETQQQLIQIEREKEAENIRLRISRDIHDDIGHSLTKISLLSDMTASDKQINSPEAVETLGRISDYSRNVNASLSEIVWAISPKHDSLDSLIVYMRNHIHQFFENTGITYKINFPDTYENRSINPELKRSIFLVLKESLNNILKYAKAKNVTVDFKTDGDQFELKIEDDGIGFDPSPLGRLGGVGGNGLPNMKYRIEQTGGSFEINSSVGSSCEIIAKGKLV